ncbi:MAG: hypothetical protein GXO39_06940, partial [Thermotogae bacterium]|nr:hypothetical protein [Thermotogota bacterium]
MSMELLGFLKLDRAYLVYEEAKKRLRRRFSSKNMHLVLEALANIGDVKTQEIYLSMWRKRGDNPNAFLFFEAYIFSYRCDSRALRKILRRVKNRIFVADIISFYYGHPHSALVILQNVKGNDHPTKECGSREYKNSILGDVIIKSYLYMGRKIDFSLLQRHHVTVDVVEDIYGFLLSIMSGEFEGYDLRWEIALRKSYDRGEKSTLMNLWMYKAFVELDVFSLELLRNTYDSLGNRFASILAEIFLDFLTEKEPLDSSSIPGDCGFLQVHYGLMRKYRFNEMYEVPDELRGLGD